MSDLYVGGDDSLNPGTMQRRRGVYARHPAMSPKYHTGNTDASLEYMARLFIPVTRKKQDELLANYGSDEWFYTRALLTTGKEEDSWAYGGGYIDFLLQQAQESFTEKFEAIDVLSDNYVSYFYGQQPPIFQYAGVLLNSQQDDWRAAFMDMYHDLLRGTKMARRQLVVTLSYDDVFVTGVLVSMSQMLNAEMELAVPFTFQMLVKRYDTHTRFRTGRSIPTSQANYSYKITPADFANTSIVTSKASLYVSAAASFTVTNREKNKEDVAREIKSAFVTEGFEGALRDQEEKKSEGTNILFPGPPQTPKEIVKLTPGTATGADLKTILEGSKADPDQFSQKSDTVLTKNVVPPSGGGEF